MIASVLYAFPPMVRNTVLGLSRVSPEVIEAGLMAGATPRQLFWRIRTPSATRQILLGVNQTTMAAFSMVIIASIIGGTADIGWEVLLTMRKALFGESLLVGIVIALMAMVMDRITFAAASAEPEPPGGDSRFAARHRNALVAAGLALGVAALASLLPFLNEYPRGWEIYPAQYLNDFVTWLVVEHARTINFIKSCAFFFVMLPVKTGLNQTITPFTWGFEFSAPLRAGYALLAAALVVWVALRGGIGRASFVAFFAILLYFGITRLPWPAMLAMTALLGWQLGGPRLALGTAAAFGFLIVAGVWPQTMLSFYLCGLAVLLAFTIGDRARDPRVGVRRRLRLPPTDQRHPPDHAALRLLIPFVMIFKIGEFTALLAIMAYAIVPAIRYAEHGLRNVPAAVVEAATCFGCTRRQLLWRVKLPIAMPVMMLGLNQTIMFGIAMLVIAALVGTNGLGQQVLYRPLRRRLRGRNRGGARNGVHRDDRGPDDPGDEPHVPGTVRAAGRGGLTSLRPPALGLQEGNGVGASFSGTKIGAGRELRKKLPPTRFSPPGRRAGAENERARQRGGAGGLPGRPPSAVSSWPPSRRPATATRLPRSPRSIPR